MVQPKSNDVCDLVSKGENPMSHKISAIRLAMPPPWKLNPGPLIVR